MSRLSLEKLLSTTALVAATVFSNAAWAQTQPDADIKPDDEIIVVGTHIRGASVVDALPVSLITEMDLDAIAADSGEDLFRSIPSQGAVNFSGDSEGGGVNGARGDVSSINLRSLGSGYTLTLLNGRRVVLHPGVQTENLAPVVTPNLNALPTGGIKRIEVLRDGASAIYGADAVGGVVNTVLKDKYDGLQVTAKYGEYDGVGATGLTLDAYGGTNLRGGKTNITFFGSYYDRGPIFASEREYSANSDLRPLVVGTDFEGDTQFRNLSTHTAWGQFDTTMRVRQNGTALTSSGGRFHIQPTSFAGCRVDLNADICVDDGSLNTDLRYNTKLLSQMTSSLKRYNAFAHATHEFDDGHEFYGELSFYNSQSDKIRDATAFLSSTPVNMAPTGYYNIFGAEGSTVRLPGLNAPIGGLSIEFGGPNGRYRVLDAGPRLLEVENVSWRSLAGYRGDWGKWDFDMAALISTSETKDLTKNRISATLFQNALNRTDPNTAYNPFNGGDINNVNGLDVTLNPQSVIDSFLIDVRRDSKTELMLADFKLSTPDFFTFAGNSVGAAFGVEARKISYIDDRDDRLDGTQKFTDSVTGITYDSDVMNSSATPDTRGDRTTLSAFAELYVPLVAPDQNMPLVYALEVQLAGRYENASDFGGVFAPKISVSYFPFEGLQFRGAYSEGFVAPNLNVINAEGLQRSNTRTDYYRCQAEINQGTLATQTDCSQSQGVLSIRVGSKDLQAQTYQNLSLGATFEPQFVPGLTLTVDYFNIKQDDIVGIAGDQDQLTLDYIRRLNGGSNPNVVRAAPDDDDIAFFAGSGLAAVGDIVSVTDPFLNLDTRKSQGIDFGIYIDIDDTPFGNFNLSGELTHLLKFDQEFGAVQAEIAAAPEAVNIGLVGAGDLLLLDGRPENTASARVSWRKGAFGAGVSLSYIGEYYDTSATNSNAITDDNPNGYFTVDDWLTANAYVQYTFEDLELASLKKLRVRFGATNITNEDPPLSDETYGYDSAYHSNRGRFIYGQVRTTF